MIETLGIIFSSFDIRDYMINIDLDKTEYNG